ncbi:MAG: o-succinylbenzoate synthase [Friedmanniella sp.]|nr:o-succinylbenzoate synthase [Friedmanniella sp.]
MSESWRLQVRTVELPLITPFRTSRGTERVKTALVLHLHSPMGEGWAECSVDHTPLRGAEFVSGAVLLLSHVLLPLLAEHRVRTAARAHEVLADVPGNQAARSALELAVLDAAAREQGEPLARILGGAREKVAVGVSLGIPDDIPTLLAMVEDHLAQGYERITLTIEPGWDLEPLRAVRERFGYGFSLAVDANQAYRGDSREHREILLAMDDFGLSMVEQPFPHDDLVAHARLAEHLWTPLCLDESISSPGQAEAALQLAACSIINIKPARVGGYLAARDIHDLARRRSVPVWCGGMLETGISRLANLALASLPGFELPADISGSSHYFARDLTPALHLVDGQLGVPTGPGLGAEVDPEALAALTVAEVEVTVSENGGERGPSFGRMSRNAEAITLAG